MERNCVVLIPAYNPPESLISYLDELQRRGFVHRIVVDDGSRRGKREIFQQAEQMGCVVLGHRQNRGKGTAIKAGITYYQEHFQGKCDGIIITSANGRFSVESVEKIAQALEEERRVGTNSLVLGNRDFSEVGLTRKAQMGNRISRLIYKVMLGIVLEDVQTGLRGIPDARIHACLELPGKRYEYDAAMLIAFETIGYREVAIQTLPAPEGTEVQYRGVKDTLRIGVTIFSKFLKFAITSILVSIFDIVLFWLFNEFLFRNASYRIIWSTILARIISATVNYIANRHLVFQSNEDQKKSAMQFLVLSIVQCALSAILVHVLEWVSSGNPVGLKVLVDTALFFVNYKVQQHFIFVDEA